MGQHFLRSSELVSEEKKSVFIVLDTPQRNPQEIHKLCIVQLTYMIFDTDIHTHTHTHIHMSALTHFHT